MGAHDFKLIKVPLFCSKISEYQCFAVCCPETSSCASKPSNHNVLQVSLCKGSVMNHNARKPLNYNVSRSAAPKLALVLASCQVKVIRIERSRFRCFGAPKQALVPASRYYCDVNLVKPHMSVPSFILKEVQKGAHDFKLKKVPFPTLKKVNINVSPRSAAPKR